MNAFFLLALGILALWCLGSASGIAAFALGRRGASGKRLAASVGLSALALAVAWLGMSRLNLTYSRTVNGAGWSLESRWFFLLPALLGLAALAAILVRRWRRDGPASVPR